MVAKAEHLEKGENPRFVVTSLTAEQWPASALYEELYCARGDRENRIKEQLMLFADRTSTAYHWFASACERCGFLWRADILMSSCFGKSTKSCWRCR